VVGLDYREVDTDDGKVAKRFYAFGYNGYIYNNVNGTRNYEGGTICNSFSTDENSFHLWDTTDIAVQQSNPRTCTLAVNWKGFYIAGVVLLTFSLGIPSAYIIMKIVRYYIWKFISEPKQPNYLRLDFERMDAIFL